MKYYYNDDYASAFPALTKLPRLVPNNIDARFWLVQNFYGIDSIKFAIIGINEFLNRIPYNNKRTFYIRLLREIEGILKE